jgi:SAM-dependent methyltransferase
MKRACSVTDPRHTVAPQPPSCGTPDAVRLYERLGFSHTLRVVADYFQTTSLVGSARNDEAFGTSVVGLRRRLSDWCDFGALDVLDLGSGTRELCKLASGLGARRVIGVNLCQEEIDFARTQMDAEFACQDIADFLGSQPETSVDLIVALNILAHLDKNKLVWVLESAHRCHRPGGRSVAMVPNATSPFGGMTRH